MTRVLRAAAAACVFTIFSCSPLLAQEPDGGKPALPAGDEAPQPVPSPERPPDDPAQEADEAVGETGEADEDALNGEEIPDDEASGTPAEADRAAPGTLVPEDPPLPVDRPEPPAEPDDAAEPDAERQTDETMPSGDAPDTPSEESGEEGQPETEAADDENGAGAETADEAEEPAPPAPPPPEDPAELRACRAALSGLGTVFTQNDEIIATGEGMDGCGVAAPFAVTEILPDVTLAPATEMRCQTALQLALWVKEEVLPAADALDGFGTVTALNHGSTFVCRPRNNIEDAKISEHAKGNAIDIMSFSFENGETIAVSPKAGDGTPAEVFQKAAGSGACLYFTTVLGPGSDAFHNDHLHLDIAERSSDYRLCQAP